jgi:hypothetical protein
MTKRGGRTVILTSVAVKEYRRINRDGNLWMLAGSCDDLLDTITDLERRLAEVHNDRVKWMERYESAVRELLGEGGSDA